MSSYNYPSPQQSFEYSHAVEKMEEKSSLEKIVPEEEVLLEAIIVKENQASPK